MKIIPKTSILTGEARNGPIVIRYVLTVQGTAGQRYSVHVVDTYSGKLKWGRHFRNYRDAYNHLWAIPGITNVCDYSGARVFQDTWPG